MRSNVEFHYSSLFDILIYSNSIVAVHGLGGHPYKTWTEGQKLWLRDFIPKDLPRARILTFGYNAGLAFTKSTSTIRDFAVQLLESLRQLRRRTANDSVRLIAAVNRVTF